ncbi:MAG: AAA family ATPase, partial [Desulfomonilia bacterium]
MVTNIGIDGYKNLIDCDIDLHNLNVIVGPNNSGKSNFL